jgi:hypothetical protein
MMTTFDAAKEKASESGETPALCGNTEVLIQNSTGNHTTVANKTKAVLPDKERELLKVLQNGEEKPRREIEPAIGSSYCPNEVMYLRDVHGFELPCRMVRGINRYGKSVPYGLYRLTASDMTKALQLLGGVAGGVHD